MAAENQENEKGDNPLPQLSGEDFLASIDGIPLPAEIKKNLWKSINRLITGLVDVPVAFFEAKAQKIKDDSNALSKIIKISSESAAKEFGNDKSLIDRTVNHFNSKLFREQINRESIVEKAVKDLELDLPNEDSKAEIDDDWLEMFSRIAETKSKEDIQLLLAKILAGEIRNPGTFSPRTIQILSTLDTRTGKIFQEFCNVSFNLKQMPAFAEFASVLCEPCGTPENNGLADLGLAYMNLARLQDAGLIQSDLNSWRQLSEAIFAMPFTLGDLEFQFRPNSQNPPNSNLIQITCLNFTSVGYELRQIMSLSHNDLYIEKFFAWATTKFKNLEISR